MDAGNKDGAHSPRKSKHENLFRLMRLLRETQCEEEVVKPVLDELEVMRLCRSLGMMSSVNPKDFDFDMLQAGEFDEDFIPFLRNDLFGGVNPGSVKLKGVFGKQDQVSATLVAMNACSAEAIAALAKSAEGIYCVKKIEGGGNEAGEDVAGLVVFSWIQDELFGPEAVRDSPAFVLRFLTVLTPDIVCCTSESDLVQLKTAMFEYERQQDEKLSVYSVFFRVEKQNDTKDKTECVRGSSVDVGDLLEGSSSVCMLKGSYPAIAVTRTMGSTVRSDPFRRSFASNAQASFAAWLKAESQQYRIDLSGTIGRSPKLCEGILREFGMWPEEKMKNAHSLHKKQQQEKHATTLQRIEGEIAQQRVLVDGASNALFELHTDTLPANAQALERYYTFLGWVRSTKRSRKLDHKSQLALDIPDRLQDIQASLLELYTQNERVDLGKLVDMCAASSKEAIAQAVAKIRGSSHAGEKGEMRSSFSKIVAEPLSKLRSKWYMAVESSLAVAKASCHETLKWEKRRSNSDLDKTSRLIVQNQFDKLRKDLLSKNALLLKLSATARKGLISCEGTREVLAPATMFHEIAKLKTNAKADNDRVEVEVLGQHLLSPNEKHIAMFTVKVRSAVQIVIGGERMCVKLVQFPRDGDGDVRRSSLAKETVVHTLGKHASMCDYDARNRLLVFLSEDSVGIYKFDDAFKSLDRVKVVELGMCSTLTAMPFADIFFLDNSLYVTDSSGLSQSIDIQSDQTSAVIEAYKCRSSETNASRSRLMGFADNLAVGVVSVRPMGDGAFVGDLSVISRDDSRQLPILPLAKNFLSEQVSVQCIDDTVFVLDPVARQISAFSILVSVRSGSFRVRQDEDTKTSGAEEKNSVCLRKQHWLYTFYHVFEKFPVIGLLDDGATTPVDIPITCLIGADAGTAREDCHDFFSLLMCDLMALNKDLSGLDLTKNLSVQRACLCGTRTVKPLNAFLQALITFLPIQICRAEANALTVLVDGLDQPQDSVEMELKTWRAPDIAESIRFGLLSPVLRAWEGRCVVITSMGKQSTGKSYFLNHFTGSSFAIAGNRCTIGAWMTLRIMQNVMFVVLDFEGLGSFERTDQEDVFLALLNASVSMFTVFRMDMRLDKEFDGLFTMFQKGVGLLKDDERLFQGMLYMSVKDINPDDGRGVISEFHHKIKKLLTSNPDQNFVTEMYSGQVAVNCSPPFRSTGYHDSLLQARNLVEGLRNDPKRPKQGFKNGHSFHDTIRLVLAKISILDWTGVNEASQELEMNDLLRKLPGVIRTGCLIPVDFHSKDASPPQYLKQSVLSQETDAALLLFEEIGRDHEDLVESWSSLNRQISLDGIRDESIDFGPSVCTDDDVDDAAVQLTLVALFQRYLEMIEKGEFERICDDDYTNFGAMLSFLVCRRKAKAALWVKDCLGVERFMDEWEKIEQTRLLPFEALFTRCIQRCKKCQLQCMRPSCHSIELAHDCGMNHVCRSFCDYCFRNYTPGSAMVQCSGKAGHEGKCNCGKGDHTCGALCSLVDAFNCGMICVSLAGHDGDHRCSVKKHTCGVECNATNCAGKCVQNIEQEHTVHKCVDTCCTYACQMQDCRKRCAVDSHFHDRPDLAALYALENGLTPLEYPRSVNGSIRHMCTSPHACNALCESEGICSKFVRVSTGRFKGKYDKFDFDLKRMVGVRNKCAITLKPGQTKHERDGHSCERLLPNGMKTIHWCEAKCVACAYYCEKPVGHDEMHSAAHGNMGNTHFITKEEVVEWDDRKYAAGEKGIAEMCSLYCSKAGRGHVHYLQCDKENAQDCAYNGELDQRRHCRAERVQPRPDHEVDEILHAKYWEEIGWEDPCPSAAERALFAKCPYMCVAREHKERGKSQSGCDLPAWHAPATSTPFVELNGFTYISGHRFSCSHASTAGVLHHVFVLDCSGSMRGEPWNQLLKGVREYLRSRIASGATRDVVSVVTFGDKGAIAFERAKIENAVTRTVKFRGGGTNYAQGLRPASAIISRTYEDKYTPVLIFFTDGRPGDGNKGLELAKTIRHRYAYKGLRSFVVGYGRVSELGVADLAAKLGGTVYEAMTGADVGEAFRSICLSLGARAGLICNNA
ncbi:hypothetical protein PF005_g15639 [Phytophthora fragariae]|uniref:VWFA domain-containing protein n=1 Tax=Phytophthora fragariae TaxID=53985 RepID=A0A6A3EI60_9STRA|nr:hypothetical protein PF003_g34613 [Phytophthora fragariae]KAE8931936.1 hypothetical protein PF009_g18022 [Phytophthora fragariae]KAE8996486.1 hypothetical protein PF011_g15878 [Phytophthora fragariae]KAE9100307.1 hypothetical protein PF007_g15566 [Phytophthora fragariae]KAE9135328.1 hypothetical protein PF006_g14628 [Phytophthora fragariae]